jgi:hypothetical protein
MPSENRIHAAKRCSGTAISTGMSAASAWGMRSISPLPSASDRPKRLMITRSAPSSIAAASRQARPASRSGSSPEIGGEAGDQTIRIVVSAIDDGSKVALGIEAHAAFSLQAIYTPIYIASTKLATQTT